MGGQNEQEGEKDSLGLEDRGEEGVRWNRSRYKPIPQTPKWEALRSEFSKDSERHV